MSVANATPSVAGSDISPLLEPWPERPSGLRSQLNLIRELAVTSFKLKYAGSALGYVWTLFWSNLVFKEPLTKTKFAGIGVIIFGVFLLNLGNR